MSFVWSHSNDNNNKINFWKSIKFIHNFVYYLVILEICFKIYIIYILFSNYKKTYSNTSDLYSLKYHPDSKDVSSSTRIANTTDRSKY